MNTTGRCIPMSEQDFRSALRARSLKVTEQRLEVHRVMSELGHASADMVHERLVDEGFAKVTVSSVYNILSQLAQAGIYGFRPSRNSKMYFDVCADHHIHLYDTAAHEFKDVLEDALMAEVEQKLRSFRFRGYKIDGIDIQINCHPSTRKRKKQLL